MERSEMNMESGNEAWLKPYFHRQLTQLELLVNKIPKSVFEAQLTENMFSLGMNAIIAAGFLRRGYEPLVNQVANQRDHNQGSKAEALRAIDDVRDFLSQADSVGQLDADRSVSETAGFAELSLAEPDFIFHYILPNFFFHFGMVYAIARAHGVNLTKGDIDGLHQYPEGFSFVGMGED